MTTNIKVTGPFNGPDFVKGLADQSATYTVVNSTTATLTFAGGFDPSVSYTQTLSGTGFGLTDDGRYTGTVTGFVGVNNNLPDTFWTITGIEAPLNIVNTNASGGLSFPELLISPMTYKFIGDKFADTFILGSFNDVAKGHHGADVLSGLSGDNSLFGGTSDDSLTGDQGNDSLVGGRGNDSIFGGIGADTLRGEEGNDDLRGDEDDDLIFGWNGQDTIRGDAGSDVIRSGQGRDVVDGGDGQDVVFGDKGADQLSGGLDEDTLRGGAGDDDVAGGPVNDDAGDRMFGGAGNDVVTGYIGVDVLHGGRGADLLIGGENLDKLFGGGNDDVLAGGIGSDQLDGGRGNDRLSGTYSTAVVHENGLNTFLFLGKFGHDVVTDFHIDFDTIVLGGGIKEGDVTVTTSGDDVQIAVSFLGSQSILVEGVADQFNPDIDIFFV